MFVWVFIQTFIMLSLTCWVKTSAIINSIIDAAQTTSVYLWRVALIVWHHANQRSFIFGIFGKRILYFFLICDKTTKVLSLFSADARCTQEITAGVSFHKGPPIWVSRFLDFYAAQAKSALENKIWQKYYWKDVELNWHY